MSRTLQASIKALPAAIVFCVTVLSGLTGFGQDEATPSAGDFPLGVYWPGEYLFKTEEGDIDWAKNDEVLEKLHAHSCNIIWLTHTSAGNAAEMARRAAPLGIRLVAALGELDGGVPHHRRGDQTTRMKRIIKEWGDAPSPVAWGLGDEPRTGYMREMAEFVGQWKNAGYPVTAVVMAGDVPAAGALLELTYLCADIYPFFGRGNPNGPDTIAESAAYIEQAGSRTRYWAEQQGSDYWFMGAIFQLPWGNREPDEQGNVVYLPGGAPHFRMPTPAEVRWQNWAALSTGAKGLIHFSLFFGNVKTANDPNAKPLDFGISERTNSGAPKGMLYMDGRPTSQFNAMGESFARISNVVPILKRLEPVDDPTAFHSKGWIPPGDIVKVMQLRNPDAVRQPDRFAIVVNGNTKEAREVPVNVQSTVLRVVDTISGQSIPLRTKPAVTWEPVGYPFRQGRVKLAAGQGTLLRLVQAPEVPPDKPMVGGMPVNMPSEEVGNGSIRYDYEADIQKDGGAVDAVSTGHFTDTGNAATKHMNGAAGTTVYRFDMPAPIETVEANAVFANHKDNVPHTFAIEYSVDGRSFQPLAEKRFDGAGGSLAVSGTATLTEPSGKLWFRCRPDKNNPHLVLKKIRVSLTTNKQ